jgi:hypothetical protein
VSRTDNALNGRALALARVSEKAEILRRHYQETRNPLFAWEVIRLFTRLPGPPVPLPPWVSDHLRDVSSALIDLAEGIDRTQAPPIPPVGATDKQIAEFITKYRAFEERPTLDPKQAHARALRALGFLSVQGKNVFADYWRNLRAQNDAEQALFLQARRTTLKELGLIRGPADVDAERIRTPTKKSLERGRLEPANPFGPEPSRLWKRLFGKK